MAIQGPAPNPFGGRSATLYYLVVFLCRGLLLYRLSNKFDRNFHQLPRDQCFLDPFLLQTFFQEMVMKEYQNFNFQQPYQQAMYYCSLILLDQTWSWMEELEVLPNLGAEDLAKFAPMMLSRAFLECYVAGI